MARSLVGYFCISGTAVSIQDYRMWGGGGGERELGIFLKSIAVIMGSLGDQ